MNSLAVTLAWTFGLLAITGFVYVYWIRPTLVRLPHLEEAYALADTFWQKLLLKLRTWWDMIVFGALIVLPELPNIIDKVTTIDLSSYFGDAWGTIVQLLGIAGIIIRAFVLRQTAPLTGEPPPPIEPPPPLQPPV